jgi:hypothetical protein
VAKGFADGLEAAPGQAPDVSFIAPITAAWVARGTGHEGDQDMPRLRFHTPATERPRPDAGIRLPFVEPDQTRRPGPEPGIRLPRTGTDTKPAR